MDLSMYAIKFGFLFLKLNMLGNAIPWTFTLGSHGQMDETVGRIPQLDNFLLENARLLADSSTERPVLIPLAKNIAQQYTIDEMSADYYIDILTKISETGLDSLKKEQKRVNIEIAKVLFDKSSSREKSVTKVMKQRHILDAFIDAAAAYAWPHIKGKIVHAPKDEL